MDGHLFQFAILFGVLGLAAVASVWLRLPVVPLPVCAVTILRLLPHYDRFVAVRDLWHRLGAADVGVVARRERQRQQAGTAQAHRRYHSKSHGVNLP